MKMPRYLSKHLPTEQDKKDFIASYQNATGLRNTLRDVLEAQLASLIEDEENVDNLSDTQWTHKLAHRLGQRDKLRELINLLNYDFKD